MTRGLISLLALACLAVGVQAYNNSLALLGWTNTDIQRVIQDPLRSGMSYSPLWLLKTKTKQTLRALDETARANFIREALPAVKSVVMSAEYSKLHEEYIRTHHQAVNHGLKSQTAPTTEKDINAHVAAAQNQMAAVMATVVQQAGPAGAKMLFDQDMESWKQRAADKTDDERGKYQKLLARARQIEPLQTSNPAEFVKQYSLMKHVEFGGSGDANAVSAVNDNTKKQQEQAGWDQYNLKTLLKKRLTEFVAVATTVDFAAQTTGAGAMRKFVKPEYERKPSEWKTLYCLGKAPTMAGVDFARQWLKEL